MSPKAKNILIIGGGQVGGSVLMGLSQTGRFDLLVYDIKKTTRDYWYRHLPGSVAEDLTAAAQSADIIILATPIDAFGRIIEKISNVLKPGAIISDVGSVKEKAIQSIQAALLQYERSDVFYVPAHPGAGSEGQGPETAKADMYINKPFFIVPPSDHASDDTKRAFIVQKEIWRLLAGADPTEIDAASHDLFFGTTSHLQHAAVFALTLCGETEISGVAHGDYKQAGSFLRNTTRIASSAAADTWLPIFANNSPAISVSANNFRKHYRDLYAAIARNNKSALTDILQKAHTYRKSMEGDVQRETFFSEIFDIGQEAGRGKLDNTSDHLLRDAFNHASMLKFITRVAVPTVLAAALTANIEQTDRELVKGISIAQKINPSALDGTAPMLTDPAILTDWLLQQSGKAQLLFQLDKYLGKFDSVINAIETRDEIFLSKIILKANVIRAQMPEPRRGATARPQFTQN